jgi:phospholipid/cholesterol/gamma-HCH transport system substrate-binding protein
LYNNLEEASRQLDLLLLDVKYNPKRYVNFSVFGKDRAYDEEELLEKQRREEEQKEE